MAPVASSAGKGREFSRSGRSTRLLLASLSLLILLSFYAGRVTSNIGIGARAACSSSNPVTRISSTGGVWNESRLLEMTGGNRHMVYFHKADILFVTMAKAGSSSLWHWLYRGTTGLQRWDNNACKFHVHEKRSNCWADHVSYLHALPVDVQQRILTSQLLMNHRGDEDVHGGKLSNNSNVDSVSSNINKGTLRVAIQRDPFERIISAFKSKFTCEAERFSTDVHERDVMVSQLRKAANLPSPLLPSPVSSLSISSVSFDAPTSTSAESNNCMNVTEFATALNNVRVHRGEPGYPASLSNLDDHIRPQDFFFDEIDYHMVIDVSHLSDLNVMRPIIDRLPFKALVQDGISHRHSSGDTRLSIPDDAAAMLYSYSLESKPGALKFLPNAHPSSNT